MTLDDILLEIKKAETIVILTHESPDGDAVGSSLGLKGILKKIGKDADIIISEYSRLFDFMPYSSSILTESNIEKYDLAITVDGATLKRIDNAKYFENANKKIVIDHHGTNTMYGDLNFVDPVAPACAQVLVGMCKYYDIEIDKEIATCLMTGIITDTGGFRHKGITPETFEFVADMIRKGVDIPYIYNTTLCTKTSANFELSKIATNRLELIENGKIAFTYITNKDEKMVDAKSGDHESIVDIGLSLENVEISIFLRQKDELEQYKVSMRSKKEINVSDICYIFGGGGHPKAAGCLIKENSDTAKNMILTETIKKMNMDSTKENKKFEII